MNIFLTSTNQSKMKMTTFYAILPNLAHVQTRITSVHKWMDHILVFEHTCCISSVVNTLWIKVNLYRCADTRVVHSVWRLNQKSPSPYKGLFHSHSRHGFDLFPMRSLLPRPAVVKHDVRFRWPVTARISPLQDPVRFLTLVDKTPSHIFGEHTMHLMLDLAVRFCSQCGGWCQRGLY